MASPIFPPNPYCYIGLYQLRKPLSTSAYLKPLNILFSALHAQLNVYSVKYLTRDQQGEFNWGELTNQLM